MKKTKYSNVIENRQMLLLQILENYLNVKKYLIIRICVFTKISSGKINEHINIMRQNRITIPR